MFSLIGDSYKKPRDVPDTFFNPFKIQAGGGPGAQKKEGTAATPEGVATAISQRGITGIVYGPDGGAASSVIIGDEVFAMGDELSFPDDKGAYAPMVAGATVVLRAVNADSLALDITSDSEGVRHVTVPLRDFLKP
jgi:hypothetical protein